MYIDAYHDANNSLIHVVERVDGKRVFSKHPARYLFYYKDPRGKKRSIFGDRVSKFETSKFGTFKKRREGLIAAGETLFESDCNVVFRCLGDHYMDADPPKMNLAFFDIEADFDQERGFAPPKDPFNRLTAIGVHLQWLGKTICLALKPDGMSRKKAKKIIGKIPEAALMETEAEMLETFLDLIEDADVLSGWNSKAYDIPYLVNRIGRVLGKGAQKRMCLWGKQPRKKTARDNYSNNFETYNLAGRVHLDYMALYSKYTYEEKHSMALDYIAGIELGERKVDYEGTLDQLYNEDFGKFVRYNVQDVDLLVRLDAKLQFIDLASSIAHSNTVLLDTVLGTVVQIDQAVINEAHSRGLVVRDKDDGGRGQEEGQEEEREDEDEVARKAAGAFVFPPKKGLHRWIGSMDLASLYPSILRSSNMSPDTIVGQVRQTYTEKSMDKWSKKVIESKPRQARRRADWERKAREEAADTYWNGRFASVEYDLVMARNKKKAMHVDFEGGETVVMSGAQIHELVFGNNWCITRNGTILTFEKDGVIPALLGRWYSERKKTQAEARDARGKDEERFKYLDRRQLVRKILLNSAYGALLNKHSRFYDPRLGQSITLNGRGISRHMAAKVNEIVTGEYDNLGEAILYGDTDSTYFTAGDLVSGGMASGEMDKEDLIKFYDTICDRANATFAEFMKENHNCPEEYGSIISAAREAICDSGLFIKKKRYGLLVFDDDGKRLDEGNSQGKVKVKGLESQRSDTPVYMQEFLNRLLEEILRGTGQREVMAMIREFRAGFRKKKPWEKGTPKRVNNLGAKTREWLKTGVCRTGHAMASINWNSMLDALDDRHSAPITDGMKIIVSRLQPIRKNIAAIPPEAIPMEDADGGRRVCPWFYRMTSIAIPIDESNIPDWFRALPFDEDYMEEAIVDRKIDNLIGVLGWNLKDSGERGELLDELFG